MQKQKLLLLGGAKQTAAKEMGRCSSKLTLLNGQIISTFLGGDFPTAYVREQVADRWQRRESNQAGLGVYLLNIKECIVVDGESLHLKSQDEKATAAIRVSWALRHSASRDGTTGPCSTQHEQLDAGRFQCWGLQQNSSSRNPSLIPDSDMIVYEEFNFRPLARGGGKKPAG